MNRWGEIIVVDDDPDDIDIIREVYSSLPFENRLVLFHDGEEAYSYLKKSDSHPFLILSDINMPRMNGLELRDKVLNDASVTKRIIPFILLSTAADQETLKKYCQKSFQGYFEKKSDISAIRSMLENIIRYWKSAIPSF